MKTIQETKKTGHTVTLTFVAIIAAAGIGYALVFVSPIMGELPVEITEEVLVVGVTEKGVVIETSRGVPVQLDHHDAQLGEIIEVTYSVPARYVVAYDNAEKRLSVMDT